MCPDCRQQWSASTDPESEDAYGAQVVRCFACAAAAQTVGQFEKSGGDMRGLHVHVTRRKPARAGG